MLVIVSEDGGSVNLASPVTLEISRRDSPNVAACRVLPWKRHGFVLIKCRVLGKCRV